MTRKRRYLIAAAILAICVCLALGVLAMLPAQPDVSLIEEGMTRAEVEAVLGGPVIEVPMDGDDLLVWDRADGSRGAIRFGDGKVRGKEFTPPPESFTDNLRQWLGFDEPGRFRPW